ncbi:MAG: hypothetical protein ACREDA_04935 [Methylocella sp.]
MHGKTFAASAGTLKGLRERAVYLVLHGARHRPKRGLSPAFTIRR